MPPAELLASAGAYDEALAEASTIRDGGGLRPTRYDARGRFDGDSCTVLKGPFELTSDLVAGYWIWEVEDMDEAISWLRRCPNPHPYTCEVEVRPLFEPQDFIDSDHT